MSARDRMLIRGDDEWSVTVDEILAEHRIEVLAEAARRIHASIPQGQRIDRGSYWQGIDYAARIIDPGDGVNF